MQPQKIEKILHDHIFLVGDRVCGHNDCADVILEEFRKEGRPVMSARPITDLAKVLCCAEAGDDDPQPVPDALMPDQWGADQDRYERMANEAFDHLSRLFKGDT